MSYVPDAIDLRILEELKVDANRPRKEISAKLAIAESNLSRRIANLKYHKIIRRFTVDLGHGELGYLTEAFSRIRIKDQEHLDRIEKYLAKEDAAVYVARVFGQWDLLVGWRTKNNAELFDVTKRLGENTIGSSTETEIVIQTLKGSLLSP